MDEVDSGGARDLVFNSEKVNNTLGQFVKIFETFSPLSISKNFCHWCFAKLQSRSMEKVSLELSLSQQKYNIIFSSANSFHII